MRDLPNQFILKAPFFTNKPTTSSVTSPVSASPFSAKSLTNWELFLSREGQRKMPTQLKSFIPLMQNPEMRVLVGGLPQPEIFPCQEITAKITNPIDGTFIDCHVDSSLLRKALQYGGGAGLDSYIEIIKEFLKWTFNEPKYSNYGILATAGNTMAFENVLRLICNEGDPVLVEEYSYSSFIEQMVHHGLVLIPVKMDKEGLIPSDIPNAISRYYQSYGARGEPKKNVRVMYTVPTGQNPTGSKMSLQRRKELIQIAKKLDLIIVEDDPYSVLEFPDNPQDPLPGTELTPTLLSLDLEGRVIYMYTWSKVLAPNLRLGFVISNQVFSKKLSCFNESSVQQPSGISQAICTQLLQQWGKEGFEAHVKHLQHHYQTKRNHLMASINKRLSQYTEYVIPNSGMFLWLKIKLAEKAPPNESASWMDYIFNELVKRNSLLCPGNFFSPVERDKDESPYFRISFSMASEEEMDYAMASLEEVLKGIN